MRRGLLSRSRWVELCCTAPARIFGLPGKGEILPGADADIVVWDPEGSKTLSAKTQHSKGDFNIFEGMIVRGIPSHTLSQGNLVYVQGDLRAMAGAGRYIKRPAFGANFEAAHKRIDTHKPSAVLR